MSVSFCVCAHALYLYMCPHVSLYVSVCNCVSASVRTSSVILLHPICLLLLVCFVLLLFTPFTPSYLTPSLPSPPSLLPLISSLPLSLPHRLPITLQKARITQATPFHLLSSSSFLSLLTIQSPFSFICLYKVCILYPNFLLSTFNCYFVRRVWGVVAPFYIEILCFKDNAQFTFVLLKLTCFVMSLWCNLNFPSFIFVFSLQLFFP